MAADRRSDDFEKYLAAVEHARHGATAQGIAVLEELARHQSQVWQVYSDLGLWHFENSNYDQAIEHLHRAVELEGEVSVPVKNLVSVLSTLLLQGPQA